MATKIHAGERREKTSLIDQFEDLISNREVNISEGERLASLTGGVALLLTGVSRGSFLGLGLAIVGGGLIYRGLTGHCMGYQLLDISTARHEQRTEDPRAAQF